MGEAVTAGFIGLGAMGGPMALNLAKSGVSLVVHDLRPELAEPHLAVGASWADTPQALAGRCDVVFTCLPSIAVVEQVTIGPGGVLDGICPGGALFEMSTNALDVVKRIHAAFVERGAHMLEAPISGGAPGARRGRLAIWAGGDKEVFDRFLPVLRAMGDRPVHVGAVGAGLVTKLIHNAASQTMQAALVEVFVLGVKAGAEPVALWQAIRQGSIGRRRTFDGLADRFLLGRYDQPDAALRIIDKDMTLATGLGRELGVPMRIANLALADIQEAMNRGWAEEDCRAVMRLPQERAGVAIAADPARVKAVLDDDPAAPTDTRFGRNDGKQ